MSLRSLLRATGCAAFFAGACIAAQAQEYASTWERIQKTKTLRIGFSFNDPYAIKDLTNSPLPGGVKVGDSTWRGFAPVIGSLLAKALDVKPELIESSHASSIAGIQADVIDIFISAEGTAARAKSADFIPAPFLWFAMTYYARDKSAPTTWAGLNDPKYKIGVVLGAHSDEFVSENAPKSDIQRFPDTNLQIAALQAGRIDGMVALGVTTALAYGRLKIGKLITPTPVDISNSNVVIRQELDPRFHNFLTTAITYYYNNGTIERAYRDILNFRGINPAEVLPVTRELWPKEVTAN